MEDIKKVILETLEYEAMNNGHVYLRKNDLYKKLQYKGFNTKRSYYLNVLNILERENEIQIKDNDKVYAYKLYHTERKLADNIKYILKYSKNDIDDYDLEEKINDHIYNEEIRRSIKLNRDQEEAIKSSILNPLTIINSAPGTGKYLIIDMLCSIYKKYQPYNQIYLTAFQGKTANKLERLTGLNGCTIHKLLSSADYDHRNLLLDEGILIIDEFNMCDVRLADVIFNAVGLYYKVVLIGDINQLPSIQAGKVFKDLIDSKIIPSINLSKLYYNKESSILDCANRIQLGQIPLLSSKKDMSFYEVNNGNEALETTLEIIRDNFEFEDVLSYQILSPRNIGSVCLDKLNYIIRDIVNPISNQAYEYYTLRYNDKVMLLKTDYDRGIYNGEIGLITKITNDYFCVKFVGRNVELKFLKSDADKFTLAYATTIYKSLGNIYPKVIMVLPSSLTRNVLYTGVISATEELHLVSNHEVIKESVENNMLDYRNSDLITELIRRNNKVGLGSKFTIKDLELKNNSTYQLVKDPEEDLDNNKVTLDTPIGRAAFNRKKGDIIEIYMRNIVKYRIVDIT
ncbi:MAG: AAA family ATPase [bacterium]